MSTPRSRGRPPSHLAPAIVRAAEELYSDGVPVRPSDVAACVENETGTKPRLGLVHDVLARAGWVPKGWVPGV